MNIYTTLLIGWGDTGSIVAVLAAALVLGALGRTVSTHTLNLGQTMASAGGSVGFATAQYAAVVMIEPDFDPNVAELMALFFFMGVLGTIIGATVRRYLIKYYWPSGTACAIIQRTITGTGEDRARPLRMLKRWGIVAALWALPTKLALWKELGFSLSDGVARVSASAKALLPDLSHPALGGFSVSVDPTLYGIGIVVGPRIGFGILIGGLLNWKGMELVAGVFEGGLVAPFAGADVGNWVLFLAIAVLTLPSFASILFAYIFRTPANIPPGFAPGKTVYPIPPRRDIWYVVLGLAATAGIAITAQSIFDLSYFACVATIALAWPLCVMNGRITADTDINPVRLVAIVILSLFALWFAGEGAMFLLAMAVVGGTLAAMAVDMMQDFRTGYLVDANPTHQTTVQLVGTAVGALAAIPFVMLLIGSLGIGPDSSLPAPGAQVWSGMAKAYTGGVDISGVLMIAIVLVSVLGCAITFLENMPATRRWVPSLFGIGIGMLLGIGYCVAIFIGGMIKWAVMQARMSGKEGEAKEEARDESNNDTLLIGAAVFAAAALISVFVVVTTKILEVTGLDLLYLAGGH
jgi:uncharacterized oligopeptide transporter (OPT) family protein